MAKKKPTRSATEPKPVPVHQDENRDSEQRPKSAMEESQFQSLKLLNDRLVKETHEKRLEFGALVQAKEALELALKRNVGEKRQVMCGLELERDVVCVYVKSQIEEMKSEIVGLCCERDVIKGDFDGLFGEADDLRRKVVEMEENEGRALVEIEDLKEICKKLSGDKMEIENSNGALSKENERVTRLLKDSVMVCEFVKGTCGVMINEKAEIMKEKSGLELEVKNAVEKENGLLMEVHVLRNELQKKDKAIEMLTQHKDLTKVNLNIARREVEKFRSMIKTLTCDKSELEMSKMEAGNIIGDLQAELSKLKEAVTSLTELSNVQKTRNEELLSDVTRLQDFLDKVSLERDDAKKRFGDAMKSVEELNLLLKEKERRIEEAKNEFDKAKIVQEEDSFKLKKEMERQIETLVVERDSMKKNLLEAQSRIDELKAKVKSAVANSGKALSLLNETCLAVCDGYENGEVEAFSEHKFVEHLDAIKASFTNKEKTVEEMKECLENERAAARKMKSFFTIVTAASSIVAAFSAVYVSEGL